MHHDDDYFLVTKQMVAYSGYQPDKFIVNDTTRLQHFQWELFEAMIKKLDFWNYPSEDPRPAPNDGLLWGLEGISKGKYNYASRYSLSDKSFRDCFLYLLSLSPLKIPKDKIY